MKYTVEDVEQVIQLIHENQYWPHRWERVKHQKPLDECSYTELLKPFQDFWDILPDSPSIRCYPFNIICDLAEEFMFGGEDE